MIPLLSRDEVRAIDADAIARLGIPGLNLMESAGRGAAEVLLERLRDRLGRVVVVGGPGQNGGDGWVVVRRLAGAGVRAVPVLIGDRSRVSGDAEVNLARLAAMGVDVGAGVPALRAALAGATLVVDGLFGTGLDRPVGGDFAEAIALVTAAGVPVLALDVPSGIDASTGAVLGSAVRADVTATFAAHKRGLHQHPGAAHAGEIALVSIGVPFPTESACGLFEPDDLARALPARAPDVHKGAVGRVLVLAGPPGRTGAALLAATGALRTGAGLVTIGAPPAARAALEQRVVEIMTEEVAASGDAAADAITALAARSDALVLGPGFGLSDERLALAVRVAMDEPHPVVLDADALTALAAAGSRRLRAAAGPRVLTPHAGEAARLLGTDAAAVQRDRYAAATRLAEDTGHVVVLKGARTIVASPDARHGVALAVIRRGTPALATAGTGDVLAGAIAALLATAAPTTAARCAALLHAMAGEAAAVTDRGVLASEVAAAIPMALAACRAVAAAPADR